MRRFAVQTSTRVKETDEPVIVKTKQLMGGSQNVISLAQGSPLHDGGIVYFRKSSLYFQGPRFASCCEGVVHWPPPRKALEAASEILHDTAISQYGPCSGNPQLIAALKAKLKDENGLPEHEVMVTAGANQGFVNLTLTLLDANDGVVLFAPYYFNHMMAIQMTGGADAVRLGPCDPLTLRPDFEWLEDQMTGPTPPKMVVLVNPCNPTGILLTRKELQRASDICQSAGAWLVMDNTYEHFVYDGREHLCLSGDHIIHIFSFSKAYGMMGWRTGYLAYRDKNGELSCQLQKVQDTIPICPPQLSQQVALHAIREGRTWVKDRLKSLLTNRAVLLDSLKPLGSPGKGIAKSEGAIYLWARLPEGSPDDVAVVSWLVQEYQICLIPGSSCGAPGYIRVAFGNLQPELCKEAAARLKIALLQLVNEGMKPNVDAETAAA